MYSYILQFPHYLHKSEYMIYKGLLGYKISIVSCFFENMQLKETSVSGYIALQDLTKGGDIIRSRTYDAFMPLIAVALIYLVMVMVFTKCVNLLERRLRNSDH